MGSDGLFDNVSDKIIFEECIRPHVLSSGDLDDLQGAANCLATHAEVYSYDRTYMSPFQKNAIAAGKKPTYHVGGKQDDITVIVA